MTLVALVEEHARRRESLVEQLMKILLGLWGWQETLNDPVLARGTTAATIYYADIAMQVARQNEMAYVTAYAEEMGVPFTSKDLLTEAIYPRDADLAQVYGRFIDEFRWQRYGKQNDEARRALVLDEAEAGVDRPAPEPPVSLDLPSDGGSTLETGYAPLPDIYEDGEYERMKAEDEAAFQASLDRINKIVRDDLNLAAADTHKQLLAKKEQIIGYRRVIHPELSETGTCGLCIVAATRIYSRDDRLPMHTLCKCSMMAVTAESDPGKAMNDADVATIAGLFMDTGNGAERVDFNRDDLEALYAIAGSKGQATDMAEVRFVEWEHGEKGPTIAWTRGKNNRPHRSQTFADSRAMWARTIDWAEEGRREAAAAARRVTDPEGKLRYLQIVTHYDDLIARMEDNMRQKYA